MVMVIRKGRIGLIVLGLFLLGAAVRLSDSGVPGIRGVMARVGRGVDDSYSRHVELYNKAEGISVTPMDKEPDKTGLPAANHSGVEKRGEFVGNALEYKLRATKERSRRLEAMRNNAESDDAVAVVKLLETARVKEDSVQDSLAKAGYPDSVAFVSEEGVRVFVPRILSARDAGTLSGIVARASGVAMERVVIVQGR